MGILLENSALIGLIGVIIGSLISLTGVMYSEHIKLKTLEKEQRYKEKEKKKIIYVQFLDSVNQYNLIVYADMLKEALDNDKEYDTQEERTALLKKVTSVLAELDLYAPNEISSKCHKLSGNILNTVFNSDQFQKDYKEVVELIKKDTEE